MPYGSGILYRRGKVWWIQYYDAGQRVRISSGSHDRAEARRQLALIQSRIAQGSPRVHRQSTVGDLLDLLLADYGRSESRSAYSVSKRLEKHVRPTLGQIRADHLRVATVQKYIDDRRQAKAAPATINRELAILRRALRLAYQSGVIEREIPIPSLPERNARTGFVEESGYRALITAAPDYLRPIICVAYRTGIRLGELLALRRQQYDVTAGLIRLTRTKTDLPRTVPVYSDMAGFLAMLPPGRTWLFERDGRKIIDFRGAWAATTAAAGLAGLRFHDLRRSAVRNMERAGIPRGVAMAISGHQTEAVYRRYDIVSEADIRDAGVKLSNRIATVLATSPAATAPGEDVTH